LGEAFAGQYRIIEEVSIDPLGHSSGQICFAAAFTTCSGRELSAKMTSMIALLSDGKKNDKR
jgi:hypothetical protein